MDFDSQLDFESESDFSDAIRRLIVAAYESGIDVERNWDCRTDGDTPDWEVGVVRLTPLETDSDGRTE